MDVRGRHWRRANDLEFDHPQERGKGEERERMGKLNGEEGSRMDRLGGRVREERRIEMGMRRGKMIIRENENKKK